jgi:hypothetical protein
MATSSLQSSPHSPSPTVSQWFGIDNLVAGQFMSNFIHAVAGLCASVVRASALGNVEVRSTIPDEIPEKIALSA